MSSIRQQINEYFRDVEPTVLIVSTVATLLAVWIATKLYTTKNLKKKIIQSLFKVVRALPGAEGKIQGENQKILAKLEHGIPRAGNERIHHLPEHGLSHELILQKMSELNQAEEHKWKSGKVSGTVYVGDDKHIELLNKAYSLFSLSNPLHPDVFPSVRKFEAEIVQMTVNMMKGDENCVGAMTSGGTESIIMALLAYREYARKHKPHITEPEIIAPVSAHAAFDKGCHYLGIKLVHIPVDKDMRADVNALKKAITKNTIAIVGSAPCFAWGTVDPIPEMSEIARKHNIGFHTDCCLGGFVLPFAKKLGYPIPDFDFRLPGVTSISADTHKYGQAVKGTSCILYRGKELRRCMYFVAPDWTGGLYASPTMAGSRPGALIASCWASLMAMGEDGFLKATDEIMKAAQKIEDGIKAIPGLYIVGKRDAMVIAFDAKDFDVYKVIDAMKGWSLNALQNPKCIHICLTARHIQSTDLFLKELAEAVHIIKTQPEKFKDGMAPIYGMAASVPDKSIIGDFIASYLDIVLKA